VTAPSPSKGTARVYKIWPAPRQSPSRLSPCVLFCSALSPLYVTLSPAKTLPRTPRPNHLGFSSKTLGVPTSSIHIPHTDSSFIYYSTISLFVVLHTLSTLELPQTLPTEPSYRPQTDCASARIRETEYSIEIECQDNRP
jgi:hypothetical protein